MIAPLRQQLAALASSALSAPLPPPAFGEMAMLRRAPQPTFMPFASGGMGNFPYYYTDPSNLLFNVRTYNWINTSLRSNTAPVMQGGGLFTNYFLTALSKVVYTLSTADTASLNAAMANTMLQQAALLGQWKQVFGSIPSATPAMQPIDRIMDTVCSSWASPATSLVALLSAPDAQTLLGSTPAAATGIIPYLMAYLKALNGGAALLNQTALNNGSLYRALAALQQPASGNGGIQASDNNTYPAFQITTPLQDIIDGLGDESKAISVNLTVSKAADGQLSVSTEGAGTFAAAADDLLKIALAGDPNYFATLVGATDSPVQLQLAFKGLTLVNLAPPPFDAADGRNWYWPEAIVQAVQNGSQDLTGFKFAPQPAIDFTNAGPFGFITAMAISSQPTITFTATNVDAAAVSAGMQSGSTAQVSVMSTPLEPAQLPLQITEGGGSQLLLAQSAGGTLTGQVVPAAALPVPAVESVAWVHGVTTVFPAAGD